MVKLHVKRGNRSCFLYETTVDIDVGLLVKDVTFIYNSCLRIQSLCTDIEELAKYGVTKQSEGEKTIEKQLDELHVAGEPYLPSDEYIEREDPSGKRTGRAPNEKLAEVILKTVHEARMRVSQKQAEEGVCLSRLKIEEVVDMLKGAIKVAYPKGLPSYDPVFQTFEAFKKNCSSEVDSDILSDDEAQLWWAGKLLTPGNKLSVYVGKNEKTKIIAKLQKREEGPAPREPTMSEELRKELVQRALQQEEYRTLAADDDDIAVQESNFLRKSFQGLKDIRWKP